MTKKAREKHRYRIIDGKLCIEHYLSLQQLNFRKKLKNDEYKIYSSYHIKLPRSIYELLDKPKQVYLEKRDKKLIIHTTCSEDFKKINIQTSKTGQGNNGYQLTIPKKLLDTSNYERGKTMILCRIIAADNTKGYTLTLELQ
ncbi:MAG: hypothetical protein IJI98_04530 [Methanosphaera sp.]|nr:hypothetical protein [Methanosphaera sp.]